MTELRIAGGTEYDLSDMRVAIIPEGCLVGTPAVVIRLEHEQVDKHRRPFIELVTEAKLPFVGDVGLWAKASAEQIAKAARETAGRAVNWAVITEAFDPARTKLKPLVDALHTRGLYVAVETGGEYDGIIGAGIDWLTLVNPNFNAKMGTCAEAHECRFTIVDNDQVIAMMQFNKTGAQYLGTAHGDQHVERTITPGNSNGALDLCVKLAKEGGYRLSGNFYKPEPDYDFYDEAGQVSSPPWNHKPKERES